MSALLDVQRRFAGALRSAQGEDAMLPLLAGDAERNRALLGIYRGNVVANAGAALALAYPVCRRITGDDYFDGLVRRYRAETPSVDGDLNRYGSTFADFLDRFEPVRELPYLPDVARLEWSVHVAAMAADAVPLGGVAFAGLDADSLCAARLRMMPGFALHGSVWPIADIWLQHQPDAAEEFDIDPGQPQRTVVWRDGLRVRTAALGVGAHAFWAAAALAGACIGDAWTGAALHEPAFNLAATIEQSITSGWLQALHTREQEK
ncbi:MAG: putative DNA-binding domain-containing protein [Methyloversatilis sp.]|nr:putative DNA-binding domain-containing protein [Methyloversatilis sp.]MBP6195666.1 putative DNA-binding domain-containing protein [Methyloversatilis sp.]